MPTEYAKSWFLRGDEDLSLIEVVLSEKTVSPNLVCFHAQQAGEKYLKGFLASRELHVRKVHDMQILVEDCKNVDLSFSDLQENANFLSQFYIESRYPDDYTEFSAEQAKEAYEAAKNIKNFILSKVA